MFSRMLWLLLPSTRQKPAISGLWEAKALVGRWNPIAQMLAELFVAELFIESFVPKTQVIVVVGQ